jgi:hypothetical protein
VSLDDREPLTVFKQGCSFEEGEDCFPQTTRGVTPSDQFIAGLNREPLVRQLQKYYYLNSKSELERVNAEVESRSDLSRRDQLQPLWNRSTEDSGLLFSFLGKIDTALPPMSFKDRGIGNQYLRSGREYVEENYGPDSNPVVNTEDVSSWLKNGMDSMKLEDALRICTLLAHQSARMLKESDLVDQDYSAWSGGPEHSMEEQLQLRCFNRIKYLPNSKEVFFDGIHFDRRYKILETGSYEHIAGMNMNINVGINFGISSYDDVSTASSLGLNDSAVLGLPAAGIGLGLAMAGAAAPVAVAGGAFVAASGGLLVASRASTEADGVNQATTTAVDAATFLVVQKADFDIKIRRHIKCVTLKFGAEFLESLNARHLELKEDVKVTDFKVQEALTRGYMICDNKETEDVETIRESYYYVTQHFTAGDMLDDVNLLNHIWLLSLRGKRDFNEFIRILKSKKIDKNGEVIEGDEIYDYALSRLGRVYKQVVPTFPGLYSAQE